VGLSVPLLSFGSKANLLQLDYLAEITLNKSLVIRDSCQNLTKNFLLSCLKPQSEFLIKLECNDIISLHYISIVIDKEVLK